MSGPIVRSGPTKQYSQNWDGVFSSTKKKKATKKATSATKKKKKKKS